MFKELLEIIGFPVINEWLVQPIWWWIIHFFKEKKKTKGSFCTLFIELYSLQSVNPNTEHLRVVLWNTEALPGFLWDGFSPFRIIDVT